MTIRSRAPSRIDFAGGWTDVARFCQEEPGFVLNAAINLYAYVTVKELPAQEEAKDYGYRHRKVIKDICSPENGGERYGIRIYSTDFDQYVEAADIKSLEYDGNADLAKAAIKRIRISDIEITTRSTAPPGSGLGSSAAMGVALCGALVYYSGDEALPYVYAELACDIEQKELGILGGKQDQYASAIGGFNFMEFNGERVSSYNLPLKEAIISELEKHLVLVYTGKSRLSSDIHQQVTRAFLSQEKRTLLALDNLRQLAGDAMRRLLRGELIEFAKLLSENWLCQKDLHASVTNPEIDAIYNLAMKNGAVGGKACGAGGGGCLVFYCPDTEHIVRKKLQDEGVQVIDFNFDFKGLQTWEVK